MIKLKTLCALIGVCLFFACNSNQNEKVKTPTPEQEITDTVSAENSVDSMRTIVNRSMIWTVQPQGNEKDKLKAPDSTEAVANYSSQQLIELLNQNFPDVQLSFVKVSHDTIYVKIPNSEKVTSQLGDTGAEDYLASVTYTLTETKNIHFVNIDMKGGDHAEPGVYSRDDFKSLR
jgi:hypothetical protein